MGGLYDAATLHAPVTRLAMQLVATNGIGSHDGTAFQNKFVGSGAFTKRSRGRAPLWMLRAERHESNVQAPKQCASLRRADRMWEETTVAIHPRRAAFNISLCAHSF